MAFGWDVDDVEDGDEEEVDDANPYGEDEDLNYDDSQEQADGQNATGKGKQKDAAEQQEEEKQQNEKWWQFWKKRKENAPDSPKMMRRTAKQEGMPTKIEKLRCPKCHKQSLFQDKTIAKGIRLTVVIVRAVFGAVEAKDVTGIPHYRCMNPHCKAYWKRTGTHFELHPTGGLVEKKSIFHVDRS
ncbi:MAG: hypothetical protein J6A28_04565 [Clostridia bacterium]|nr:hypothetical protein [Clostridia bacterium]